MVEAASQPLLAVEGLQAWYGEAHVLHGMNFEIHAGEIVTLLGHNGVGKTTTLRAIMGTGVRRQGSIRLAGVETSTLPAHRIARAGIAWCPEERGIYASLSVAENLVLPPVVAPGGMSMARILALFPVLAERADAPGMTLSGGEQQMLAIARILRTGARLLLLDEPTEGLAPVIVQRIGEVIATLRDEGFTILLVEQNLGFAAALADRHYIVEHGTVTGHFTRAEAAARPQDLRARLGV